MKTYRFDIYRIELIDRLRATSRRNESNTLNILLRSMEDNRIGDIQIDRLMLDIIIEQDKQLDSQHKKQLHDEMNKKFPSPITIDKDYKIVHEISIEKPYYLTIEEDASINTMGYDAIFMKSETYINMSHLMGNGINRSKVEIGSKGTLNEMIVIVYDDINKDKQLEEYAVNYCELCGRHPNIILIK